MGRKVETWGVFAAMHKKAGPVVNFGGSPAADIRYEPKRGMLFRAWGPTEES